MALFTCPHCGGALALLKADAPAPAPPAAPKPAAQKSPTADHWEAVTKTVTCNRCGATELAWLKGRSGKAYLAIARRLPDGRLGADRREFHQCPGPPPPTREEKNLHGLEISDDEIPF